MRLLLFLVLGTFMLGGVVYAQAAAPGPTKGYVEGVGQSAFGNVTSQSYGAEGGVNIKPMLQVYGEFGRVRDAAPSALGTSAQLIAGFLGSGYTVTAKEPITFGGAGVRFLIPASSKVQPYVLAGAGMAQVKKDVVFSNGGTDVTANLAALGVVLGSDLSGTETKGMLTLGAGVVWPVWQRLIVDLQYRYGRVFASDAGINVNRAGVGIGVRF